MYLIALLKTSIKKTRPAKDERQHPWYHLFWSHHATASLSRGSALQLIRTLPLTAVTPGSFSLALPGGFNTVFVYRLPLSRLPADSDVGFSSRSTCFGYVHSVTANRISTP